MNVTEVLKLVEKVEYRSFLLKNPPFQAIFFACGIAFTCTTLLDRMMARNRVNNLYVIIMTFCCILSGPTIGSILQGSPASWFVQADTVIPPLVAIAVLVVAGGHYVTRTRVFKLFAAAVLLAGAADLAASNYDSALAEFKSYIAAVFLSSYQGFSRVLMLSLEAFLWGESSDESIAIKLCTFQTVAYAASRFWFSQNVSLLICVILSELWVLLLPIVGPINYLYPLEFMLNIFLTVQKQEKKQKKD